MRRASDERRRAAGATATASRLEVQRDRAPLSVQPLLSRLVRLYRSLEIRHLEAARLQESYASRLEVWAGWGDTTAARPTFIDAVAAAIGKKSTGVTLMAGHGPESLVATSGHLARRAHDAEFVTGEGPVHEVAATMGTVRADGSEMEHRWPRYGPMVVAQGVGSLISLPLRQEPGACVGALSVFNTAPVVTADTVATSARVADAVIDTVLNAAGVDLNDQIPAVSIFDDADFLATVHQAAGVVAAHYACRPDDAVALLRARAFADGVPVETLAKQVIRDDVQL